MEKIITTPLTDDVIRTLKTGDMVFITGKIYTARDAAHKRLVELEKPPFDYNGQIVYYAGPCPNRPEHVIGSIGPTTSGRMDAYSPALMERGLKCMIGKGFRSREVIDAIMRHTGVYFAAIGGAGALMSQCVKSVKTVAFEDLGTEAVRELEVERLPVIVAVDCSGNDIYRQNP